MLEQLPFKHLMVVLLEGSSQGVPHSILLSREAGVQVHIIALLQKLDDDLCVAYSLPVQLDPGALGSFLGLSSTPQDDRSILPSVDFPENRPHRQWDCDHIRLELWTGHNFGDWRWWRDCLAVVK